MPKSALKISEHDMLSKWTAEHFFLQTAWLVPFHYWYFLKEAFQALEEKKNRQGILVGP